MAVYTDHVHLVADTLPELHAFARKLGLRPEWFHDERHPHYDLTTPRARQRAVRLGAEQTSTRHAASVSRKATEGQEAEQ